MARKSKAKHPVTAAIRVLRAAKVAFEGHLYDYAEKGGTRRSSSELGVDEHGVIKTLVMEDGDGGGLLVLMHGDKEVATGLLAKAIGTKRVTPSDPKQAQRLTGYQVGGTSPFGSKTRLPIYAQRSIRDLEHVYINGGKRGFLVRIAVTDLDAVLEPVWVEAAAP